MLLRVLLALLLVSLSKCGLTQLTPTQEGIELVFTCWYTTYENNALNRNAVFGYINSYPFTINLTQPPAFNELDVDGSISPNPLTIFFTGSHLASLVVPGNPNVIEWQINSTNPAVFSNIGVILSQETNATMCWNLFNQTCSIVNTSQLPIPHFCDDGNFCNGLEFCQAGVCQRNGSFICDPCSDNPPICGFTNAPIAPPTIAPTTLFPTLSPTTPAPTNFPTPPTTPLPTRAPTKAPTSAPTRSPTTRSPTSSPTLAPTTRAPTEAPSAAPTNAPTMAPDRPEFAIAFIFIALVLIVIICLCCYIRLGRPIRLTRCVTPV